MKNYKKLIIIITENYKIKLILMHEVKIDELKPGVFYLAKDKYHEEYHYQGTFEYLTKPGSCLFAHFKDCKINNGKNIPILRLSDDFVFYEKDAELIAYTNSVLRKIIGDPDFSYNPNKN